MGRDLGRFASPREEPEAASRLPAGKSRWGCLQDGRCRWRWWWHPASAEQTYQDACEQECADQAKEKLKGMASFVLTVLHVRTFWHPCLWRCCEAKSLQGLPPPP